MTVPSGKDKEPEKAELARFLGDGGRCAWELRAAEGRRKHVEGSIRRASSDVGIRAVMQGRPNAQVCPKNPASYELRVNQRRQDQSDVARLDVWPFNGMSA